MFKHHKMQKTNEMRTTATDMQNYALKIKNSINNGLALH